MSLATLLVHDVTILTSTYSTDRYNNQVRTGATSTVVKGWISQRTQTEDTDQREARVSDWVLFLHPEASITGLDRVAWEGLTFEVTGPANPAWSPAGLHHLEVPLRVVVG